MYRFLLLLIMICIIPSFSFGADLSGFARYSYNPSAYKDNHAVLKKANESLRLYESTDNKDLKDKYLKQALRYYYICTKNDFKVIDCHIGLGKAYDDMGVDRYAKMEFNSAYNIDNRNPALNYRYGDFYYKRRQLNTAQHYFERAYKNGYSKNLDLNQKMAKAYIKLAEPQKAEQHQKIVNDILKVQKQQKTKVAMNSAIKQASGISVKPNVPVYVQTKKAPQPVKVVNYKSFAPNVSGKKMPDKIIKFETAVINANKIKMIDDLDNLKPMYYLFIK